MPEVAGSIPAHRLPLVGFHKRVTIDSDARRAGRDRISTARSAASMVQAFREADKPPGSSPGRGFPKGSLNPGCLEEVRLCRCRRTSPVAV